MKRDFNVVVKGADGIPHARQVFKYDEKGMPVLNERGGHQHSHFEPMTLRTYALDALAGRWKKEEEMGNDDLFKRGKLHDKLCFATDGAVDVSTDEIKMILDALNHQGQSALVITRMKAMLESDPQPAAQPEGANERSGS